MSKLIIELNVHLYDKYFGILKCDFSYLPYIFYAEYMLLLLSISNKSYPVKTVLFISNRIHQYYQQKVCYMICE